MNRRFNVGLFGLLVIFAWVGTAGSGVCAAPETETWYDSKGKAIQLPKSPSSRAPFVPQWEIREAGGASGQQRRYRTNRGDWWNGWSDAGWYGGGYNYGYGYGYGSRYGDGFRFYGGYVRPRYSLPVRSHSAIWYRNGSWGVRIQSPGFSVQWNR